jgi:hypothetical protein
VFVQTDRQTDGQADPAGKLPDRPSWSKTKLAPARELKTNAPPKAPNKHLLQTHVMICHTQVPDGKSEMQSNLAYSKYLFVTADTITCVHSHSRFSPDFERKLRSRSDKLANSRRPDSSFVFSLYLAYHSFLHGPQFLAVHCICRHSWEFLGGFSSASPAHRLYHHRTVLGRHQRCSRNAHRNAIIVCQSSWCLWGDRFWQEQGL